MLNSNRSKTMRLSIDLTKEQHQAIKSYAVMRGMSMKDFVLDRVLSDDVMKYNQESLQVFEDTENGVNLSRYNSYGEFLRDMDDA